MPDAPEIDIDQIMERIRENIRHRRSVEEGVTSETHVSPFDEGHASADLAYLHSGYDIRNVVFTSHRLVIGRLVVAAKKALRRLLLPVLDRQVAYNAASTRVTTNIKEWMATLDRQQADGFRAAAKQVEAVEHRRAQLREEIQAQLRREALAIESRLAAQAQLRDEMLAIESRLAAQVQEVLAVQAELREDMLAAKSVLGEELALQSQALRGVRQSSEATREKVARAERKLRRVLHVMEISRPQDGKPLGGSSEEEEPSLLLPGLEPSFDYAGFEERFRGSEEEVRDRQQVYVRYFEGREDILDIGCGRGEFLELLRENGVRARGVDLDLDMILLCREKGLDVVMDEVFAYLGALADDSVGGIFAAQVIEHLPPTRVIELTQLCYRKLGPGGVVIFETPNPKCLMVFADSFYRDPSHTQPTHPDTMQFLFEATGFQDVELKFLGPVDPSMRIPSLDLRGADVDRFNQGIERVNSLLFGFRDYAVIGRKHVAGTGMIARSTREQ
jgi:SAM-dependent methyltransferase